MDLNLDSNNPCIFEAFSYFIRHAIDRDACGIISFRIVFFYTSINEL